MNAASKRQDGSELIAARLYANNVSMPLLSIFEHVDDISLTVSESEVTSIGRIPSTLKGASILFSKQLYQNHLQVEVSGNRLTVGVKKTSGNTPADNWTVFDNFELYYLGAKDATHLHEIKADTCSSRCSGTFDLAGRKISDDSECGKTLPGGIYIINGRKQVVH